MSVTPEQREAIVSLLRDGVDSRQIAAQVGVQPGTVSAIQAHLTRGSYGDRNASNVEAEVADAMNMTFGLERDLQMALRGNIEQLEPGLTIIDGGREKIVASGRIDITARDQEGATVVIELKAMADREAIGQILGYMGDLTEDGAPVRGILVAHDFVRSSVSAARVGSTRYVWFR